MGYCTTTDITNALSQEDLIPLTDDSRPPTTVVTAVVTAAIVSADAVIDSFLAQRYSTPLDPVPTIIQDISIDLTCYNLYNRKRFLAIPESIKDGRQNAIALLEKIQRGTVVLPDVSPSTDQPSSLEILGTKTADDRMWTDDVLGLMW